MQKNNPLKYIYWPFLTIRAKVIANLLLPHMNKGERIIDIGTGNMLISQRLKSKRHVYVQGIDVIDMNLTNLPHEIFDGKEIPFTTNNFDTCLLIGVLHHIKNQEAILKEAIRVAKKKIIIFEDTYTNPVEKQWIKIRDIIGNLPEEFHMNFALKFRSEQSWEELFLKLNLEIKYKKTFFNYLRLTHHTLYIVESKKL